MAQARRGIPHGGRLPSGIRPRRPARRGQARLDREGAPPRRRRPEIGRRESRGYRRAGWDFSREISAPAPHDDWRALVRSLGPATRFFLPAAIAAIAAIVILACVARGPAAGSHGTAGHSASIAAAPRAPAYVGATQLARGSNPTAPRVSTRGTTTNDASRRPCPSSPRARRRRRRRTRRSGRRTAVRRESPRPGGGARAPANTAVARAPGRRRARDAAGGVDRVERAAEARRRRAGEGKVGVEAQQRTVVRRVPARTGGARTRRGGEKVVVDAPRARHDRAGSTRAGTRRSIRRRRVRCVRRRRTSAGDRCCT